MNEVVMKCLQAVGWNKDNVLDVDFIKTDLVDNGWEVFDIGLDFLSKFNGLPSFSYKDLKVYGMKLTEAFDINYKFAIDNLDWAQKFKYKYGIKVMPCGNQGIFDLFIDENGAIYCIDADYDVFKLGNDLNESLNNLFGGIWIEKLSLI